MRDRLVLLLAALVILCCNTPAFLADGNPGDVIDCEVHEWGVMAGCDGSADYLLTSRPLQVVVVKEPVLYFHSVDKKPFTLKVVFKEGHPTETYPLAEQEGNTVVWRDVSFTPGEAGRTKGLGQEATGHVPLEDIMRTLNDVDADVVYYKGEQSRFLFYEGEMPFKNGISCTYGPDGLTATVINHGSFPVFDLFVISRKAGDNPFQKDYYIAYIPQLKPDEKIQVRPAAVRQMSFSKSLKELGFTERETRSFELLWNSSFLEYGKLLYRLPAGECDKLISLEFSPRPKKITRALYVLVKQ